MADIKILNILDELNNPMTHASLFSGIGGPEVAAAMLGWENVFHCEINDFGRAILEYHFPQSKSYIDVTKTNFTEWRGRVDVLTGGFPCQPFSYAGRRGGAEDDRYLWPQFKRVIAEVRPAWVVGENVAGITTMVEPGEVTLLGSEASLFSEDDAVYRYRYDQPFTVERVCSDLEQLGYAVQPVLIPACAVGAPHRRDRVFFIAYSEDAMHLRCSEREDEERINSGEQRNTGTGDTERHGCEERVVTSDTEHLRLQHNLVRGSETRMLDKETIRGEIRLSEQVQLSKANGERGITSDTENKRTRQQLQSGCRKCCQSQIQEPRKCNSEDEYSDERKIRRTDADTTSLRRRKIHEQMESQLTDGNEPVCNGRKRYAADASRQRLERQNEPGREESWKRMCIWRNIARCNDETAEDFSGNRWADFPTVSPVHRGNDGIPFPLDCLTISPNKWRTESLKAYGNAIVPQVMYEIFRAIEQVTNQQK